MQEFIMASKIILRVFNPVFFPGLLLFLLSPFVIFLFFLSIRAIRHFKYHFIRAKNNFIAYSAYRGEGRYFKHRIGGKIFGLEVDEFLLRMLVEPIALFKIGFAFVTLSIIFVFLRKSHPASGFLFELIDSVNFGILAIGVTLVISSFSLFLEEYSIMQNERNTILDMFDGEQDMQQILAKKDKLKTERPKVSEEKILENSDVQLS
jgi:hypothetical protein